MKWQHGYDTENYTAFCQSGEYEVRLIVGKYLLYRGITQVGEPLGYPTWEAAQRAAERRKR